MLTIVKQVYGVLLILMDFLFPNACLVCEKILKQTMENICSNCLSRFELTNYGDWVDQIRHHQGIDEAYSIWFFTSDFQKVIHSLKYKNRAKLGAELGRKMIHYTEHGIFDNIDLIVPVPLHPVKKRDRGYNQAEWIGRGIARSKKISFQSKILVRKEYTVSQTKLNSEERRRNLENAFSSSSVKGLRICLIDDVLTTGSTLSACAVELKAQGAKKIVALTCATPKLKS